MFLKFGFIFLLSFFTVACAQEKLETQIFLIPVGYTGFLEMVYDVPQEESAEYEGSARVHRFNEYGVSLTPLSMPAGWATGDSFNFFYVDKNGSRTPILLSDHVRFEEFENNIQDTSTYIMDSSIGTMSWYQCQFDTKSFYVGSYRNRVEGTGFTETSDYFDNSEHSCFKSIEDCPCNTTE